jgi:hypothetical protein
MPSIVTAHQGGKEIQNRDEKEEACESKELWPCRKPVPREKRFMGFDQHGQSLLVA